jgi:Acetyltransferase (GNAT) domain
MVTIERRVHGVLRYRKFWFPGRAEAMEISNSIRANDLVRFFGVAPALDVVPHLVEQYKMPTLCINLAVGPQAILDGMSKKSCRYEIRRAEKMLSRVAIEIGSEKANRDFLTLYNEFNRAKGLPQLAARWMQENSTHCETFVLYRDAEALCAHLLLRDSQTSVVRLLYSGSTRLASPEQALACGALNRYLHWQEMQRFHALGFRTFDFGGVGRPDESISRFKLSFGGTVLTQHFYLLSGMQWVARLGQWAYRRILRRRTFKPTDEDQLAKPSEDGAISIDPVSA